jgi:hypothetical protein
MGFSNLKKIDPGVGAMIYWLLNYFLARVFPMKTCKNCGLEFEITAEDKKFYEKAQIPEPTFCPVCRVQRRMAWRNDRSFYVRKCDKNGKEFVSIYPQNTPFPVYSADEWWKDDWDPLKYGQEVDFSKPFFEQWRELMNKVPRLGIDIVHCENSYYCNYCGDDKNCYLDLAGEANEDCYYNLFTKFSKNCADCTFAYTSELCYEVINCHKCWNCRWSMYLEDSNDCAFCFDLKGCSDCLFCFNLRHKKHHVFNKSLTKTEYEKFKKDLNLGSREAMDGAILKWKKMMAESAIHRDMWGSNAEDCSGDGIKNSKNCHTCFNIVNSWDCKYLYDVLDAKDCYDLNYSLYKPEVACELISTLAMKYSAFNMASHYCDNVFYCDQCNNTSECFGCIALNRYKYCILNKQYSEEEYKKLKARLIEYMVRTGEWGEFFPAQISPCGYNETVAMEYMPITKEEALKKGYKWKEVSKREFVKQKYEIPDVITDVPDVICDEVLACVDCGKNFKIIPQEFKFYKERILPVPMKCPDCRHLDRMKIRTPRQLWDRTCSKCGEKIISTYEPTRPEKVYCAKCYEGEVY